MLRGEWKQDRGMSPSAERIFAPEQTPEGEPTLPAPKGFYGIQ